MSAPWQLKPLGEVTMFLNGLWKGEKPPYVTVGVIRNTNFAKDGSIDDSDIAFMEVEAKKFAKRKLEYGDIVLEKSGGGPKQPVGRVALFEKQDGAYSFSNFTAAIRVRDQKELDFRFLHMFLFWKYASGVTEEMQSHSTGIRNLNADAYKAIEIPLPPLAEQQRIVAILSEIFAGLTTATNNAEKNLKNARELFEEVNQSAMMGKVASGDSIPTGRPRAAPDKQAKINDSEIPFAIPSNWRWCRFGSVVEFLNGDRGKNYPNKHEYVPAGIPWINTGHIREGGILDSVSMHFITKKKFDTLNGGKIKSGDLVYCLRGATIGKTAFVEPYTEGAVASSLMIVRPGPAIDRRYAYYFLISRLGRQLIKRFDNGAAQPNLGGASVAKYVTPLPPLKVQKEIVQALDALAERRWTLERIYIRRLEAIKDLKQSILRKAFSGELTALPSQAIEEAAE